ncbi:MAG: archease [archaeon]|jgi:SHS2 domain-containing protein|nr:archease [archaeon]
MKKYRFLEHTADALFEAFGRSFEELLINSAKAMCFVMYEPEKVEPKEKILVKVRGENNEVLLHNFLSAVLFEIQSREMIFKKFKILSCSRQYAEIELQGEKIDREKHELKSDIKAVTWHEFFVKAEEEDKWIARVLIDV